MKAGNLVSKITPGLSIISTKAEASNELTGLARRFSSVPAWRNENIREARITEGARPVIYAKSHIRTTVIKTLIILNLCFRKKRVFIINRLSIIT